MIHHLRKYIGHAVGGAMTISIDFTNACRLARFAITQKVAPLNQA